MSTKDDGTILEAALAYAKRGWPIFPIDPNRVGFDGKKGKAPYKGTRGVLEATTDARQVEEWWRRWPEANVALDVGGAGMMVLDLDPGHDMQELEKNVGTLPNSLLRARTPRGGGHLYYALEIGELVSPSSSKLAPHVDVRSFHSYVLLPPSKTEDGSYIWEDDGKPAYRTDEMVRAANTARDKDPDRDKWIIEPDLEENKSSAVGWLLEKADPAIDGQGGDHCAYATAAMMIGYGLSEETAVEVMWEHWNPQCIPPWRDDEYDHFKLKVHNAYNHHSSQPGKLTPAYKKAKAKELFTPRQVELPDGDETHIGHFRFVDRAGMDFIAPPQWIVRDFLADDSYALLYGKWGSFKTFVALDMALSVACGFPSKPTWDITMAGPVLFAIGEGRSAFTKRVRGWEMLHHGGARVENFVLADPVPTTSVSEEALEAFIGEALRRHPDGYRAIFIDTLGRAMEGADENSQRDASAMTALAYRLRHDLGGSVLAVHHSGKDEARGVRGSSVIGADADTIVRSARRGKDRLVTLHMTKQKDAPEWDTPRLVRLYDVSTDLAGGTLAAGPPLEEDRKNTKKTKAKEWEDSVMEVLDRDVRAVLEANPMRAWTQKDLAGAVTHRADGDMEQKTVAAYLLRIRNLKKTYSHSAYDPTRNRDAGRWRHPS